MDRVSNPTFEESVRVAAVVAVFLISLIEQKPNWAQVISRQRIGSDHSHGLLVLSLGGIPALKMTVVNARDCH